MPLGILPKSENKTSEMVEIMSHLHQYVPGKMYTQNHFIPSTQETVETSEANLWAVLLGGDQLTAARARGAIDGYSLLITFLQASNNNRADTVLSVFTSVVEEYGLSSRIRIDRGGENVHVSQYMLDHPDRGPGRSVIARRSVHNQRIERLWRDLYSSCVHFFFTLPFIFWKTSGY